MSDAIPAATPAIENPAPAAEPAAPAAAKHKPSIDIVPDDGDGLEKSLEKYLPLIIAAAAIAAAFYFVSRKKEEERKKAAPIAPAPAPQRPSYPKIAGLPEME